MSAIVEMETMDALRSVLDAAAAEMRRLCWRKEAGELFAFDSCPGGNDVRDAERWADWLRPYARHEWMTATRKALELLEGLADLQAWFDGIGQLAAIVDDWRESAERPRLAKARFPHTYCSSCGGEFGPGDAGFSHCFQHATKQEVA